MSNWTTSNYRQKKAARRATQKPEWFTNPETGQRFFLRPVGAMAFSVAGYTPNSLTAHALEGWKEHGIEPEKLRSGSENGLYEAAGVIDEKIVEEGKRNQRLIGRTVYESCVIPCLYTDGEDPTQILDRALQSCDLAFADEEEWKEADEAKRIARAEQVVMHMEELDDPDVLYIFRAATGQVNAEGVPLKGGQVMQMADLKSIHQKAGRRSRTGTSG